MNDVTLLIPVLSGNVHQQWLDDCIASFPEGTPHLILPNRGDVAGALNRGLKEATTEFVCPFGSDDLACPGFLEYLLAPSWNADVVYPTMEIRNETLEEEIGVAVAEPFCGLRLQEMNYVGGGTLIRRSKALEVGGYRTMGTLEDWDMYVRLYRAGGRFKPQPAARMIYRFRDGSRNAKLRDGNGDLLTDYRERIILGRGFGLMSRFRKPTADPLDQAKATFYNAATPATTYMRCQLPARYLPGVVQPNLSAAFDEDGEFFFPNQHGSAAVLQLAAEKTTALMGLGLRHKGYRVLVESDDNYFENPGRATRERNQWGERIGERAHTVEGHAAIVREAAGVIVTTDQLANSYRKHNPNVYVCPNTVDPPDWPAPVKPDDGWLRIVWFASASHSADLPLITRAFEWAAAQPGVEVNVVGLSPDPWVKIEQRAEGQVIVGRFPFRYWAWFDDLDAYRQSFSHFDIGVAPIKGTPFANGRSDVKALEYAMGGCAPILSDGPPYKHWVDGETCMKAKDARGFLKAVQHLVAHRDEVKQLAAAAREYALAERTTEKQIHFWEEAISA